MRTDIGSLELQDEYSIDFERDSDTAKKFFLCVNFADHGETEKSSLIGIKTLEKKSKNFACDICTLIKTCLKEMFSYVLILFSNILQM